MKVNTPGNGYIEYQTIKVNTAWAENSKWTRLLMSCWFLKLMRYSNKSLILSPANCLSIGLTIGTCLVNGLPDVDLLTFEMWMLIIHFYDPPTIFYIYDIKKDMLYKNINHLMNHSCCAACCCGFKRISAKLYIHKGFITK